MEIYTIQSSCPHKARKRVFLSFVAFRVLTGLSKPRLFNRPGVDWAVLHAPLSLKRPVEGVVIQNVRKLGSH